jgi:hypothetical protein
MRILRFPIHAILFSIYPIVYLLARNVLFIPFQDSFRSMALSVGVATVLLLGFRIILKGWEKAGATCSLILILFFSFGHIANNLEKWAAETNISFNVFQLAWIWLFIFLLLTFILIRANLPGGFTHFLNILSAIFMIFPLLTIISSLAAVHQNDPRGREVLSQMRVEAQTESALPEIPQNGLPDVY